ncbi:type II secretion system minor pseudopilin GspH [Bordetella sp. 2513F-2]
MRTSAPGSSERGFTLVEILVVLVIVGIGVAMVSVSAFPSADGRLRADAEQLLDAFAVAQSEARSDGRPIRWQADEQGWRFERRGRTDRLSAQDDAPLRPDRFEHDALLHGRAWQSPPVTLQADPGLPLVFDNEWIAAPLVLQLQAQGDSLTIVRDAAGRYAIEQ